MAATLNRATQALSMVAVITMASPAIAATPTCEAGAWIVPATGERIEHAALVADAARAPVVLLGETHDNAEHHRWQLSVVAGLLGHRDDVALGFEAFPRRVQPVLDRWVAGDLDADTFLEEVDWWQIWGFEPDLYMPLLDLARLHRIPVIALNVERSLVARVADEGWAAVPPDEREGIGDPAEPPAPYRDTLAHSFAQHAAMSGDVAEPTTEEVRADPAFARFVEAQLAWDRAMAEAIADAYGRPDTSLMIGIIGSGHLRERHGVPWQLADLGIAEARVLLPRPASADCEEITAGLADAVFTIADPDDAAPPKPRLGVALRSDGDDLTVASVAADSVAASAGIEAGDVIVRAGGQPVAMARDLAVMVQRQMPGAWLPLAVRRGDRALELVAKFPVASGPGT